MKATLKLAGVAPGGAGAVTVKVKLVVWVTPPPLPVTVMVEGPAGVEAEVVMVRVVGQEGGRAAGEEEAEASAGGAESEKGTDCAVPESSVAVMVLEAAAPWGTDWLPLLAREKSKAPGTVTVKVKLVLQASPPVAVPVTVMV